MSHPANRQDQIPDGVVCVADYERVAAQRIQGGAWAYLSGGAGDEITLGRNTSAFERTMLLPRVLNARAGVTTRVELFGQTYEHPIFVAPVAHLRLAHRDGERATAMGAAAQDAGLIVSTHASTTLEDVAAAAGPRRWFQLYVQDDAAHTQDLMHRAEAAGYEALVVTVDAPIHGLRNREQRTGFMIPAGMGAVNLAKYTSMKKQEGARAIDRLLEHAPRWSDIERIVAGTRLPVIVKGILTSGDAQKAIAAGVAGIVVSNHGGRTLDTLPSTFDMLPEIVDAVAGRVPVLVDGGIRRGTDVLKCMATGASGVLVGRPVVFGLAVAGALGVSHVLRILRDELEIAMALTGCTSLADAQRGMLRRFD